MRSAVRLSCKGGREEAILFRVYLNWDTASCSCVAADEAVALDYVAEACMCSMIGSLGFRVWGLGFRVMGFGIGQAACAWR